MTDIRCKSESKGKDRTFWRCNRINHHTGMHQAADGTLFTTLEGLENCRLAGHRHG
jgi:hypothetical protein